MMPTRRKTGVSRIEPATRNASPTTHGAVRNASLNESKSSSPILIWARLRWDFLLALESVFASLASVAAAEVGGVSVAAGPASALDGVSATAFALSSAATTAVAVKLHPNRRAATTSARDSLP